MRKFLSRGFTLVELLIVIALLAVIATIVIAAINPIEQANRAADAGKKADASQLVSALERYYTTHSGYPWMAASCATNGGSFCNPATGADAALNWMSSDDPSVGICGASGAACKTTANKGELISSLELQTTFLNKSWIGAALVQDQLKIGKASGASSTIFVCWSPKSNSNRQVLIASAATNANKMFDTTTNAFQSSGIPAKGSCTSVSDSGWATGACSECVPE